MINTEDLAAGIMGLTGPYNESLKKATAAIDKAISAAVAAERERTIKQCADMIIVSNETRANLAAAIRALK